MRYPCITARAVAIFALTLMAALTINAIAYDDGDRGGLSKRAKKELRTAGLNKYLGEFTPDTSQREEEPYEDWTKHTFDADGGDGPICIAGTPYSVFTKAGDPKKLLIFLQGGGACWEDFANCNVFADDHFPPPAAGIFTNSSADGTIPNDIGSWSVVYLPYCDGSVFTGDNDVVDPTFLPSLPPPFEADGIRRHRGLRNLSAGLDVARKVFGTKLKKILIAGSSAGGAGSAAYAPFLARFLFKKKTELYVFNDAGPLALNPTEATDAAEARAQDWKFDQFYPQSCIDQGLCDPAGQQTGIIQWRLDNDLSIRESFYSTDGDLDIAFFIAANAPGTPDKIPVSQSEYRIILEDTHGAIHAAHPDRYKRFIVSGDNLACGSYVVYTHTALQGGGLTTEFCHQGTDLFYELEANGLRLSEWTNDFVRAGSGDDDKEDDDNGSAWIDIVEDFFPGPPLGS